MSSLSPSRLVSLFDSEWTTTSTTTNYYVIHKEFVEIIEGEKLCGCPLNSIRAIESSLWVVNKYIFRAFTVVHSSLYCGHHSECGAFQVDCPARYVLLRYADMDNHFHLVRPEEQPDDLSLNFPPNKCSLASSR